MTGKGHSSGLWESRSACKPTDYTPFALLWLISKAVEKLVHSQIENYITSYNLFDELQSVFTATHGTQAALLKLTYDVRIGMIKRLITMNYYLTSTRRSTLFTT